MDWELNTLLLTIMASSSLSKRGLQAALVGMMAVGTVLPSGPAKADEGPGPMYHVATAAPDAVAQITTGPITEIDGADLKGTMEFDGTVRVLGDIDATRLHLIADNIEVMGAVKGTNVWLHARAEEDRQAQYPSQATVHEGQIIIHGDVQVTDSRIGAAGTAKILINGHTEMFRQSSDYGRGGGHLTAQEVCVTGDLYSQFGTSITADKLTIGRDLNGNQVEGAAYTHPLTEDHPGSTVIGRNVNLNDSRLLNAELTIGGYKYGQALDMRAYRHQEPVAEGRTDCGFEPRADRLSFAARP